MDEDSGHGRRAVKVLRQTLGVEPAVQYAPPAMRENGYLELNAVLQVLNHVKMFVTQSARRSVLNVPNKCVTKVYV